MPLAGDLAGFNAGEVILFIMRGAKTGRLVLRQETAESSIFFDKGIIIEVNHAGAHGPDALVSALAVYAVGQFEFHEGEQAHAPDLRVDTEAFAGLQAREKTEEGTMTPVLPELDEKLTTSVSFDEPLSLTPLQWVLLACIPRQRTLRHLGEGRDLYAVKKALAPLLVKGLVQRTGEMVAPVATAERLVVVKGYTREEEAVELDSSIVARWRELGVFSGKVTIEGHIFVGLAKEGLGRSIVMSAPACRLCGVRDAQEVAVTPAPLRTSES